MYVLFSENKGADQLCIYEKQVFTHDMTQICTFSDLLGPLIFFG